MAKRKAPVPAKSADSSANGNSPPHIDPAIEAALANSKVHLVPWAWFVLGWSAMILRVGYQLAMNFGSSEYCVAYRSIPFGVSRIRSSLRVLKARVPRSIRENIEANCRVLEQVNFELLRGHRGLAEEMATATEDALEANGSSLYAVGVGEEMATATEDALEGLKECSLGLVRARAEERPWLLFASGVGSQFIDSTCAFDHS